MTHSQKGAWHLLALALLLLPAACGKAEAPKPSVHGFAIPKHQPVKAKIIAEPGWFNPDTSSRVGVHFALDEGWHIYTQDPGDAGMPTQVAWQSDSAVVFGELVWPQAEQFVDPGDIKTNGYRGSVILWSSLSKNPNVKVEWASEVGISAHVKWLACKEICLPGEADLTIQLPVKFESVNP